MDMRDNKTTMLKRMQELEQRLSAVYNAGLNGIAHVGAANYQYRQDEAEQWVEDAMRGDLPSA